MGKHTIGKHIVRFNVTVEVEFKQPSTIIEEYLWTLRNDPSMLDRTEFYQRTESYKEALERFIRTLKNAKDVQISVDRTYDE